MNNTAIFPNRDDAETHAASMVAQFWLESANRIIKRGESPAKLSDCGGIIARDELDRSIYNGFRRRMDTGRIRRQSIRMALARLADGQFPLVKRHFTPSRTAVNTLGTLLR